MIKLKINWGVGLVITLAVFIIISLIMVLYFMNQKVDLVTDNYYEKTLTYQTQIDEAERSREFNELIKVQYLGTQLKFIFPDSIAKLINNGEVYFYRPSDSNKDFKSTFVLDENGEAAFDETMLEKGYWKVYLKWVMNGESYSVERTLMIN